MTSLAFMLVEVPAPPWITSTTKWPCQWPSMISWQARSMAAATSSGEQAEASVGPGRRLLDHGQGADQVREVGEPDAGDGEVLHRTQGLDAVARVGRHLALAEQVVLGAGGARPVDQVPAGAPGDRVLQPPHDHPGDAARTAAWRPARRPTGAADRLGVELEDLEVGDRPRGGGVDAGLEQRGLGRAPRRDRAPPRVRWRRRGSTRTSRWPSTIRKQAERSSPAANSAPPRGTFRVRARAAIRSSIGSGRSRKIS